MLSLPAEIRCMIWRYALPQLEGDARPISVRSEKYWLFSRRKSIGELHGPRLDTALFLTCRVISCEAREIFYKTNEKAFRVAKAAPPPTRSLKPALPPVTTRSDHVKEDQDSTPTTKHYRDNVQQIQIIIDSDHLKDELKRCIDLIAAWPRLQRLHIEVPEAAMDRIEELRNDWVVKMGHMITSVEGMYDRVLARYVRQLIADRKTSLPRGLEIRLEVKIANDPEVRSEHSDGLCFARQVASHQKEDPLDLVAQRQRIRIRMTFESDFIFIMKQVAGENVVKVSCY